MELVIRNARLRGRDGLWRIGVENALIKAIVRDVEDQKVAAATVIDAEGGLVTEPFVDAHLHLCKAHTLDLAGGDALSAYTEGAMGGAMTAIEAAAAVKAGQTTEGTLRRARGVLRDSVAYGVRVVQAFADVDPVAGLTGVEALLTLKQEFRDVVDVQVVAFPQDGLLRAPGTEDLIEEALRMGADVVGGIPWIEFTDEDAREHVERMVALADRYDRRVAMLVDDAGDPTLRTTEMLASALLRRGLVGRGSAQHARAMALYPEPYLLRLAGLCAKAGLGFVSDPHTGPLHLPVFTLRAKGLNVALGQDDIEDAYYPFGRHNLLEVAFLAAHLLGPSDLDALLDMVTVDAARVLGREHVLREGAAADLVVLYGGSVREVLTRHERPRYVIVTGRIITNTTIRTEWAC